MQTICIFFTFALFGAARTFAEPVNYAAEETNPLFPFSQLDKDGDNSVSRMELYRQIDELNLHIYLNDGSVAVAFMALDKNKDHHIGYDDFDMSIQGSINMMNAFMHTADKDKNGKLNLDEVKEVLKTMHEEIDLHELKGGEIGDNPSHAKFLASLNSQDKDGNGRLSFEEFTNELDSNWQESIKTLDKNNDHHVSPAEVKDAVSTIIQKTIWAVDKDGDDKISFEELKDLANPETLPNTIMKAFDENGDGHFSYNEYKNLENDKDPLNIINKVLDRLDNALGSSARSDRTGAEWKTYASIVACGFLMSWYDL